MASTPTNPTEARRDASRLGDEARSLSSMAAQSSVRNARASASKHSTSIKADLIVSLLIERFLKIPVDGYLSLFLSVLIAYLRLPEPPLDQSPCGDEDGAVGPRDDAHEHGVAEGGQHGPSPDGTFGSVSLSD